MSGLAYSGGHGLEISDLTKSFLIMDESIRSSGNSISTSSAASLS